MKYFTPHHRTNGYSLVEALVAIAVLLVGIVGSLTIAARGIQVGNFAEEQTAAFFLAQEGIEFISIARDSAALREVANPGGSEGSWDWVDNLFGSAGCSGSSCALGIDAYGQVRSCGSGNEDNCDLCFNALPNYGTAQFYIHSCGDAVPTGFNRIITLTKQSSVNAVEVQSTVTWQDAGFGSDTQSAEFETVFYDIYD